MYDENGQLFNEVFPHSYAMKNVAFKDCKQVRAEQSAASCNTNISV